MSRTAAGAGDAAQLVALVWMATSTSEPGRNIVLIGLSYVLPAPLFGPVAGMLADRMNRCALAISCDVVRIICALVLMPVLVIGGFIGLLAVLFVYACATLLFTVSLNSAIPDWVPGGALLKANSLLTTSGHIAAIVGSSVGGVLLAVSGEAPFLANSALLLVSALSLFALRFNTQKNSAPRDVTPRDGTELDRTEPRESFKGILRYVFFDRQLRSLVILATCAMVSFTPVLAALAVLVKAELHGTSTDYGLVQVGVTSGLAVGAVVVALAGRRTKLQILSVGASYALMGAMTILLSQAVTITGAVLIVVLRSGANSASAVVLQTMVQQQTISRLRGRVLGVFGSFQEGARGAALPLGGWLVDMAGPRPVLLAMGLALLPLGGIAILIGRGQNDLDRRREALVGGSR